MPMSSASASMPTRTIGRKPYFLTAHCVGKPPRPHVHLFGSFPRSCRHRQEKCGESKSCARRLACNSSNLPANGLVLSKSERFLLAFDDGGAVAPEQQSPLNVRSESWTQLQMSAFSAKHTGTSVVRTQIFCFEYCKGVPCTHARLSIA